MVRMSSQDDTESALYKMHRCRQLIYGLLHLMTSKLERNDILPLFGIEESFPERFYVLLRLTMKPNENYAAMLEKMELEWNSQRVRFSFQMIASLVQTDSAFELNIIEPAQDLLEDLWSMDEEECNGCLSALLDQILRFYLDKGQKHLEKNSTDVLLKLFSKQDFARRFLECSILCADLHKTTANDTIIKCCLLKAVDERSDMVSVRLQCLSLVGRLQSRIWSMKDSKTLMHVWTADTIRSLFTLILHDSSVRVRRLAVQICTHLSASNILNMEEFTKVCLMKARDQDDKVRLVAIQILSSLPVKLLADCLTEEDWKVIWMRGLHEEKDEARKLAEALILDYVTTDTLAEFPSTRLQFLGLMDCGSSSEQCSSFIYDNVDAIFDKELEYLDHNCTQPDN
ncbi:hypothetical protein KP509_16G045600 [Ceratopteris richardii]|uniref:Uncharacterized protein n=1 Tax=Ceratopteris richardii TaxID=49495 RepID=A0A8T2T0E5_CERRI|nr:hypothetical protein KP509_16G045600 [Ceratopteris richardii]